MQKTINNNKITFRVVPARMNSIAISDKLNHSMIKSPRKMKGK